LIRSKKNFIWRLFVTICIGQAQRAGPTHACHQRPGNLRGSNGLTRLVARRDSGRTGNTGNQSAVGSVLVNCRSEVFGVLSNISFKTSGLE
jgi:hypothetical protein